MWFCHIRVEISEEKAVYREMKGAQIAYIPS
jgi:hypothetical protein